MAVAPVAFACEMYPEGHAYPGLKALLIIIVEFPGVHPEGKQLASQPTCFLLRSLSEQCRAGLPLDPLLCGTARRGREEGCERTEIRCRRYGEKTRSL